MINSLAGLTNTEAGIGVMAYILTQQPAIASHSLLRLLRPKITRLAMVALGQKLRCSYWCLSTTVRTRDATTRSG